MEQKIRIGAVNYLNTKPMITGLETWEAIELSLDYPAKIAEALLNNRIDIGLVPIAILPKLQQSHIITNYGIAALGSVATVCVYSEVPIEQVRAIILDYQSKTSVELLKILLKEYWKLSITLENGTEGFENSIINERAGLVIGDRAFELNNKYEYVYDLSEIWLQHTGLPFVFAAWVANKEIQKSFINTFEQKIEQNISSYFTTDAFDGLSDEKKGYLKYKIKHKIDLHFKKGMDLFLQKVSS